MKVDNFNNVFILDVSLDAMYLYSMQHRFSNSIDCAHPVICFL